MNPTTPKMKVMVIFGTRPEAIKMAPLILELQNDSNFETLVTVTAQHRDLLDQVLKVFRITPDYDLNIMKNNQTLVDIQTHVLTQLDEVLRAVQPDLVLVHGDTTTTFVAALAAFNHQIPIGHVEAGLRTYNKYSPFPEEMNRLLTGNLADLHFAPTEAAYQNLLKENKDPATLFVTGNTAIDALKYTVKDTYEHPLLSELKDDQKLVLLTAHRRENQGQRMTDMFQAIRRVVEEDKGVVLVYPVHPSPEVRRLANLNLSDHPRIHLYPPFDMLDFHNIMAKATLVLTDSGGIQEEAPYFGIPVIVLRDTTERPEGIEAGTSLLVGTDGETLYKTMKQLLNDPERYSTMAKANNPYGDGHAAQKIVATIKNYFNKKGRFMC